MSGPPRSKEELKDMCIAWYLKYGERGVAVPHEDTDLEIELMNYRYLKWDDSKSLDDEIFITRLTPKALELIKS